ncbi:hypothetical protein KGA66_16140 [Actinocrinis puniceicyclus]|uniref:Uncharacterized protein n=1 Tax=Actinocrinis puniceicyclus TaxID=977794 RepID=A0A8J7WQJ7_9ACTN|nr:SCO2522 family protein [Actinocrinis puniceicyclus]MBS2964587.1 hypothetical protein [Actinocrinis puniceicyclus]
MDTSFRETSTLRRVQDVAYSHLSVELDHLYMEDFLLGEQHLRSRIEQVAPWFETAVRTFEARRPSGRPRVSTCFLVDDYFSNLIPPAELLPMLREAADKGGVRVDYVARESACAQYEGVEVAAIVAGRLVSVPVEGTDGSRPPVAESGWLSNGQRSPSGPAEALRMHAWQPPVEAEARQHSIFVDVQLWSEKDGERLWSCPMLAAVWQLSRLGLLRDHGRTIIQPRPLPEDLPAEWSAMPAVIQLNRSAAPFHGYCTLSLLDSRFLGIEHAVRVILDQVTQDAEVMTRVVQRALQEGMRVAQDVTGRIAYTFMTDF